MITLHSSELTVVISPIGAEIHHVIDKNGVERIWQNETGAWDSHTPLLFPIAGGLKNDTWFYEGKPYTMNKHGFARRREFAVEMASDSEAVLALTGESMRHPGFPFACELRVKYRLAGDRLDIAYEVKNVGEGDAWFSVGSHEAYACAGGIENFEVVFPEDSELTRMILSGGLLTHETAAVPLKDHVLRLTPADFLCDTLAFTNLSSREVTLRRRDGAYSATVLFPQCDTFLIWQKMGEAYLCLEPWCNAPDYEDCDQQLTHKPGMMRVPAGEAHTVFHALTFR